MIEKPDKTLSGDFSAEDDQSAVETFENAATGELERLKAKLKYEHRKKHLIYMRALGRAERQRLKMKYGWES